MDEKLFNELLGAVTEAAAYHRGAQINLRTTVLPDPPAPLTRIAVRQLRTMRRGSQAVFAHYLNVSTKLVQAWESGARPVEGPALTLLHIAEQHPEIVFPSTDGVRTNKVARKATKRSDAKPHGIRAATPRREAARKPTTRPRAGAHR